MSLVTLREPSLPPRSLEPERRVRIRTAPEAHVAFPSVARLADGRWLVTYREGSAHVDPAGRIVRQVGAPDLSSWSAPETALDLPDADDRDPSVSLLPDGRLGLTWFPARRFDRPEGRLTLHTAHFAVSTDGGRTFEGRVPLGAPPVAADQVHADAAGRWLGPDGAPVLATACTAPVVAVGDRLVAPLYGGETGRASGVEGTPRARVLLADSADGGRTWRTRTIRPDDRPDLWLTEPALAVLPGGRQVLVTRSSETARPGGPGPLLRTASTDGGRTWAPWESLGIVAHAPDLLPTPDGRLVLGVRLLTRACDAIWVALLVSGDGGDTWGEPLSIAACGVQDCGYPSLAPLPDGRLLVVYYADDGHAIEAAVVPVP